MRSVVSRAGAVSAALLLAVGLTACTSAHPAASPATEPGVSFPKAAFVAHGSVGQVYVTGAPASSPLTVVDRTGRTVAKGTTDTAGSLIFRDLAPGSGYHVVQTAAGRTTGSGELTVLTERPAPPDTSIYDATLPTGYDKNGRLVDEGGYGYVATRDGTTLAVNVKLPGPPDKGPYPTVIEYAGYGYARPSGPQNGMAALPNLLGYATVDVNMRGTGCSGGAFHFFEPLQDLDGYDIVETVARQPWVMNHQVGMIGISYGGISQLFVGQTNPPHLAAIAPMSVIASIGSTAFPGGVLNSGFTVSWAKERVHDALPATETDGQKWAYERIQKGDKTCKANQALRLQAVDLGQQMAPLVNDTGKTTADVSPISFVDNIHMPVFLTCQFEDEQTGGYCPSLVQHFTGTSKKWFTFTNGTHVDSIDPSTLLRFYDFLELYVAKRKPTLPKSFPAVTPIVYSSIAGLEGVNLPDPKTDPVEQAPDYAHALARWEAQPSVRVDFENGAGQSAGLPFPTFSHDFASLPAPGTQARTWYFGADGALTDAKPASAGSDSFLWDPSSRPDADLTDSSVWSALPNYNWTPVPAGKGISYVTAPLTQDVVVFGAGSVHGWIQSTAKDTDLQATISEVRPDGQELFVQNGWLRASRRKLTKSSTPLVARLSMLEHDVADLPAGKWSEVTIPLYYEGHVYRKGSRLRVTISAPGGDQPSWKFAPADPTVITDSFARTPSMPSGVVLPVVPGLTAPKPLPSQCRMLRGEPCRPYVPAPNTAGPQP